MLRCELLDITSTIDSTIQYCRTKGLLLSSAECSKCGQRMREITDNSIDKKIWICTRKDSGRRHKQTLSIRANSVFSGSHLSLRTLLMLIYEWSIGTLPQETIRELKLTPKTVNAWYSVFRTAACQITNSSRQALLGGLGICVEIDECQIGRRKYHRGRLPNEMWVFGGIIRDSNPRTFFLVPVPSRSRQTLEDVIQQNMVLT
jgi:hypothetical protein